MILGCIQTSHACWRLSLADVCFPASAPSSWTGSSPTNFFGVWLHVHSCCKSSICQIREKVFRLSFSDNHALLGNTRDEDCSISWSCLISSRVDDLSSFVELREWRSSYTLHKRVLLVFVNRCKAFTWPAIICLNWYFRPSRISGHSNVRHTISTSYTNRILLLLFCSSTSIVAG